MRLPPFGVHISFGTELMAHISIVKWLTPKESAQGDLTYSLF
jgi:hypothetical protein